MGNSSYNVAAPNVHAILEAAGYVIHGRRASCPHCSGHSRLTVSFSHTGAYYCHRCGKGGSIHSLARAKGIALPPPRVRKADIPKAAFRKWLSQKMTVLADEEHDGYLLKEWASAALRCDPNDEAAWSYLAEFYQRKGMWETFWQSCGDKCGRFYLFRAWRRHYAN